VLAALAALAAAPLIGDGETTDPRVLFDPAADPTSRGSGAAKHTLNGSVRSANVTLRVNGPKRVRLGTAQSRLLSVPR
jgi:hypothetical protein